MNKILLLLTNIFGYFSENSLIFVVFISFYDFLRI